MGQGKVVVEVSVTPTTQFEPVGRIFPAILTTDIGPVGRPLLTTVGACTDLWIGEPHPPMHCVIVDSVAPPGRVQPTRLAPHEKWLMSSAASVATSSVSSPYTG
jgi:hypothetical protein